MTLKELIDQGALWSAAQRDLPLAEQMQGKRVLSFGIPTIDRELFGKGLTSHAIHEWFIEARKGEPLCPPQALFTHLLRQSGLKQSSPQQVLWIGEEIWPAPYALEHSGLIERSIFLRVSNRAEKLRAIDTILRSPACAAVVAYLDKVTFALTQRFSLAARVTGAWFFLLRPQADLQLKVLSRTKSAAMTRWLVKPELHAESSMPVWRAELLKQKGRFVEGQSWVVEALSWDGLSERTLGDAGGLRLAIERLASEPATQQQQLQVDDLVSLAAFP